MIAGAPADGGIVGVPYLRVLWERMHAARAGDAPPPDAAEYEKEVIVMRGLELGLHETVAYICQHAPAFAEFEHWVLERNGGSIAADRVARINAAVAGDSVRCEDVAEPVLSGDDLAFWDEQGYVVVHDAVPPEQCAAASAAICEYLGADLNDLRTWYGRRNGHSIWVPLLRHAALSANRHAPRVRRAFAQLWGRSDLWVTVDRTGFNPPERHDWRFPGPHLHWDTALVPPVQFDVSGILYLTDTAAEQGAFTCVPGFHHRLDGWLRALPAGADPQKQDLAALGPVAVAGRAGDLIIWNSALPHGASPNRTDRPRIVQYIQMQPSTVAR
ncbi:MAG: Phytanoyl-CoA dioxygenase [Candidatus Eremiobacteraeota bacterium]|nr:Phytanoyl-CoA dioxygenase [Candidatus Eremiobacteraeota bacterium]